MGSDLIEIDRHSVVILKSMKEIEKKEREILANMFLLEIKGTKDEIAVSKMVDGEEVRSKDFYEKALRKATDKLKAAQIVKDRKRINIWLVAAAYICYRLEEKEKSATVTNATTKQPYVT